MKGDDFVTNDIYSIFDEFLRYGDFYPKPIPGCSNYYADRFGNVYKPDGSKIIPFNSNGYEQVYMRDDDDKRKILGVHQVVGMTFLSEYYPGCVVHHKDENKHNNNDTNLIIESRSDHSRHHADPSSLINHINTHGPHNKGKKMSPEFCEPCRQSALKRHREKK